MQYLLSEDEMVEVRIGREVARKLPSLDALVNVCQHVADTMITTVNVNGHGAGATRPYGCIHTPGPTYGYCDRCPVLGICPQSKDFSK